MRGIFNPVVTRCDGAHDSQTDGSSDVASSQGDKKHWTDPMTRAVIEGPERGSDQDPVGVIEGGIRCGQGGGLYGEKGRPADHALFPEAEGWRLEHAREALVRVEGYSGGSGGPAAVQRVPVDGTAPAPMVAGGRGKERRRIRLGCADLDGLADDVAGESMRPARIIVAETDELSFDILLNSWILLLICQVKKNRGPQVNSVGYNGPRLDRFTFSIYPYLDNAFVSSWK